MPKLPSNKKVQSAVSETPAFITGSYAYGEPRHNSDIDLVFLCAKETSDLLWDVLGEIYSSNPSVDTSMRAGKVNMIYCLTRAEYDMWLRGTAELIAVKNLTGKPVSKEQARDHFAELRTKLNKENRENVVSSNDFFP